MNETLWVVGIIAGLILLFLIWFFFGAFLKILLLWLPSFLIMSISIGIGILIGGIPSAIIIIIGIGIAYTVYEKWEYSDLYSRIEKKLSSIFHFE